MDKDDQSTSSESSTEDEANTATPLDADSGATPDNQEAAPDSSPEADGKETVSEEDFDPLSVVKKAIGEDKKTKEGSDEGQQSKQPDDSSQSEKDGQEAGDDEGELGDVTEDELKSYKPKTRKRIEGLLDDRQRLTDQVESMRPATEQMEQLQKYMQERNLTPENVSEGMLTMGLAMSDNPKDLRFALERSRQFVAQLETQLGELLPEDLQNKVDEGLMSADDAKEVALGRVAQQRAQVQTERANQRVEDTQRQSQATSETAQAQAVHSTISDWERQKMSTDPDYPRKAELLRKEIQLRVMQAGGKVLDRNKAIQIAEDAYAEVTRTIQAFAPSKAPEAKRMTHSKASPGNMASKPNSALDAAKAGLAKTHGG